MHHAMGLISATLQATTLGRLPFCLHAREEFEEVGQVSLGDGLVSIPVPEFRAALVRDFQGGKIQTGIDFQSAN